MMLSLLLSVVILITTISTSEQIVYTCDPKASCGCSVNPVSITRIVGGESANFATWSWMISISINNENLCGGSTISSSWILTAAHCVSDYAASQITIYAGSTLSGSGTQRVAVSRIILHPQYVAATYENDIALLQIFPSLPMNDPNIGTICLPSVDPVSLRENEWPEPGTTVVAIGWGRLSENGPAAATLQQVTLSVVDYRDPTCRTVAYNPLLQFCAGVYGGGKDTCQGDSGGPLMMFTSSRQWLLVGLTSFGEGCARPHFSGVYTRVALYENWIRANTDDSTRFVPWSHASAVQTASWFWIASISFILLI